MAEEPPFLKGQEDRRRFLQSCGRFAVTVPPAMTVLLSTSLSSKAIAKSTGGGGPEPDRGPFKGSDSGPTEGEGFGHSGSSQAGLVGANCAHDRQKTRRAGCK